MIDSYLNAMSHWPAWAQVIAGLLLGSVVYSLSRPWLMLGNFLDAQADLAKAKAKRIASRKAD